LQRGSGLLLGNTPSHAPFLSADCTASGSFSSPCDVWPAVLVRRRLHEAGLIRTSGPVCPRNGSGFFPKRITVWDATSSVSAPSLHKEDSSVLLPLPARITRLFKFSGPTVDISYDRRAALIDHQLFPPEDVHSSSPWTISRQSTVTQLFAAKPYTIPSKKRGYFPLISVAFWERSGHIRTLTDAALP